MMYEDNNESKELKEPLKKSLNTILFSKEIMNILDSLGILYENIFSYGNGKKINNNDEEKNIFIIFNDDIAINKFLDLFEIKEYNITTRYNISPMRIYKLIYFYCINKNSHDLYCTKFFLSYNKIGHVINFICESASLKFTPSGLYILYNNKYKLLTTNINKIFSFLGLDINSFTNLFLNEFVLFNFLTTIKYFKLELLNESFNNLLYSNKLSNSYGKSFKIKEFMHFIRTHFNYKLLQKKSDENIFSYNDILIDIKYSFDIDLIENSNIQLFIKKFSLKDLQKEEKNNNNNLLINCPIYINFELQKYKWHMNNKKNISYFNFLIDFIKFNKLDYNLLNLLIIKYEDFIFKNSKLNTLEFLYQKNEQEIKIFNLHYCQILLNEYRIFNNIFFEFF